LIPFENKLFILNFEIFSDLMLFFAGKQSTTAAPILHPHPATLQT
jgi:hypothetical protein